MNAVYISDIWCKGIFGSVPFYQIFCISVKKGFTVHFLIYFFSNPFINLSSIDIPNLNAVFISFAMQYFIQFCIAVCRLADVNNENWILIRINWFKMISGHIKYACYMLCSYPSFTKKRRKKKEEKLGIDMSFYLFVVSFIWKMLDFSADEKPITDWFLSWCSFRSNNNTRIPKG